MKDTNKESHLVRNAALTVLVLSTVAAAVFGWLAYSELSERKEGSDFYSDTASGQFLAGPGSNTLPAPPPGASVTEPPGPPPDPTQSTMPAAPPPVSSSSVEAVSSQNVSAGVPGSDEQTVPTEQIVSAAAADPAPTAPDPVAEPSAPAPGLTPVSAEASAQASGQTAPPAPVQDTVPAVTPLPVEPVAAPTEAAASPELPSFPAEPDEDDSSPVSAASAAQPELPPASEPPAEPEEPTEPAWDTWCYDHRHVRAGTDTTELDFDEARKIYPDIAAWLKIDALKIDMPVVYSEDTVFYLNHLPTKQQNILGSLVIDSNCRPDLHSDITTIHGHHMNNGYMFGDLDKFSGEAFWREHPVFYLYTPDGDYEVQIVAACVIDGVFYGYPADLDTEEAFQNLVQMFITNCSYRTDVVPQFGDRLLLLSTCAYSFENARFVVLGVLR